MKINVFKIEDGSVSDLSEELLENEYEIAAEKENEHCHLVLYVRKKHSENEGWLSYYKDLVSEEDFSRLTSGLISEALSGVFLVETEEYSFAIVHGQAHFIVRKFCNKDFGLDLAERIVDPKGLKMKHSQTFTSASKKDITSYTKRRNMGDSQEYGEAFSYVKCKTINKEEWGESADFGESVRFSFGKGFFPRPDELYRLTDRIYNVMLTSAVVQLPRYHKVTDKEITKKLDIELRKHFKDYLTGVDVDDYWLTGVSFNFSNEYHYSVRFLRRDLSEIMESIDITTIRKIVIDNIDTIGEHIEYLKLVFYDENDEYSFSKLLLEFIQVTLEYDEKYYVLFHNEWVEFSDSYISYIKEQVDSIAFTYKNAGKKTETQLISSLVKYGKYKQLHKENVYYKGFCIEKADLMDDDNVIMIKDQRGQADLVYLIKQATTALRLTAAGEIGENIFNGRNVCLWMLINRKQLKKLSDFKSFHLLDALNDFKREVTNKNLTPIVWISLKK